MPAAAHPYIIAGKIGLFFALVAIGILTVGVVKLGKITRGSLPAVLSSDLTVDPGLIATLIYMVLPQFLVFYIIASWNDLDLIYSARQPWACLASPRPARLNLTLNYLDCRSRLWKALVNKHYLIAVLSIGSILSFFLPILAANFVQLKTEARRVEVRKGTQSFLWDLGTNNAAQTSMPLEIPLAAINAIIKPPGEIDWVVRNAALLPVEFKFDDSEALSRLPAETFWQVQTTSLHGNLTCTRLTNSTIHYNDNSGYSGLQPREIDVVLPPGKWFENGARSLTKQSCGGTYRGHHQVGVTTDLSCFHWILRGIRTEVHSKPQPAWVFTLVHGELDIWHPTAGPLFQRPRFQTLVLL
jgi:hypothetical protein